MQPTESSHPAQTLGSGNAGAGASALQRWWALTAPPEPPPGGSFAAREVGRRARLVSVLLLALLLVELGSAYQYFIVDTDHPIMKIAVAAALVVTALAAVANRAGWVTSAGLLLVLAAELPLAGIPGTAVNGQLDVLHLGGFYLLAGSELVAASVLMPWSVFVVAALNSVAALGLITFMDHTPTLANVLASNDGQQAFSGPVIMQVIVAIVAFLWAQNVKASLRRADRAEEIALLEQRELERSHELEEDVQQLLAVHVQMANGNFNVRVPQLRTGPLWQIGNSFNNLLARFARLAQAEFVLRRTQAEAHSLAEAIHFMRSGRQPLWPAQAGTPLDEVITALGTAPSRATGQSPVYPPATAPDLGQSRPGGFGQAHNGWGQDTASDLPDWLRPR